MSPSLPIFDPLPVPPFEIPERVQRLKEEEARLAEAAQPSPDKTQDPAPSHTPIVAVVQAPVAARVQAAPAKGSDPVPGLPVQSEPVLIQPVAEPPSRG